MNTSLIGLLISIAIAALLVFPFAKPLKAHPGAFYVVALVLTALFVWAIRTGQNLNSIRGLCMVLQKGYLASILLGVVMFTGCFDEGTPVRKRLQPIRGELSILSFIFIIGHVCMYLPGYLVRRNGLVLSARGNVAFSLAVAIVLTIIFALLAVLSFRKIHKAMSPRVWKGIQRLAYLMVALFVLHAGFVLGVSGLNSLGVGRISISTVSFFAYIAVVVVYAVMRTRKYLRDRTHKQVSVASAKPLNAS